MRSDRSDTLPADVAIGVDYLGYHWVGKIGRIDSAFLGFEDHGIFSVNLGFDFGGSHQGLGHILLSSPSHPDDARGIQFLERLCETVGPLTEAIGRRVIVLYRGSELGLNAPIRGLLPISGGHPFVFTEVFQ